MYLIYNIINISQPGTDQNRLEVTKHAVIQRCACVDGAINSQQHLQMSFSFYHIAVERER
jgi:hypothetical protein